MKFTIILSLTPGAPGSSSDITRPYARVFCSRPVLQNEDPKVSLLSPAALGSEEMLAHTAYSLKSLMSCRGSCGEAVHRAAPTQPPGPSQGQNQQCDFSGVLKMSHPGWTHWLSWACLIGPLPQTWTTHDFRECTANHQCNACQAFPRNSGAMDGEWGAWLHLRLGVASSVVAWACQQQGSLLPLTSVHLLASPFLSASCSSLEIQTIS